jgi:hypothetical protein
MKEIRKREDEIKISLRAAVRSVWLSAVRTVSTRKMQIDKMTGKPAALKHFVA